MKITLVYPDVSPERKPNVSWGVAYIAAVLKRAGHSARLLHYCVPVTRERFVAELAATEPDLVAFSSSSLMFRYAELWSRWARELGRPAICGGVHASVAPEEAIQAEGLDAICVGEGEDAVVELCERLQAGRDFTDVPNLWVKRAGMIHRNAPRPLIEDLDRLPFPDMTVFDYRNLAPLRRGLAPVMASRGCPMSCTFCCNHRIRAAYPNPGAYVRFRSVDHVLRNIEELLRQYPEIRALRFWDDILPLRIEWFREFVDQYRTRIGLPFICYGHVKLVTPEVASLLRDAGCRMIIFGVQSGNERILRDVLRRATSRSDIVKAIRTCHEHGLATAAENMVGLPFERMENILETIRLNAEIQPTLVKRYIFFPFPHTDLYDVCAANGFLTDRTFDTIKEGTPLEQPSIAQNQVRFAYLVFLLMIKYLHLCRRFPPGIARILVRIAEGLFLSRLAASGVVLWTTERLRDYLRPAAARLGLWKSPVIDAAETRRWAQERAE